MSSGGIIGLMHRTSPIARWSALLAMLALVAQALLPAAVMAAPRGHDQRWAVCTASGLKFVERGDRSDFAKPTPTKNAIAGMACLDCVACAMAATETPTANVVAVRYATALKRAASNIALDPRIARAPPRPPGQGPPIALNA